MTGTDGLAVQEGAQNGNHVAPKELTMETNGVDVAQNGNHVAPKELTMETDGVEVAQNGNHVVPIEKNGVEVAQNGNHVAPKELTAKETEALKLMREKIAVQEPESKDTDDATLLRFLRARSLDVTKSSNLFVEHQKWRREYFPSGHVQVDEIKEEIEAKKYYIQGRDRQGRPIGLFVGKQHVSGKGVEQFKKLVTLFVDKLIASLPPGEDKFCVIADLKGLKYKNLDVRGWLAAYDCLQAYYPERLGIVYVLNAPTIFWGAWKVLVRFLDPVTKAKIMFVDDTAIVETLLKDIDKEEIPIIYGGSLELVPVEAMQPPNWPTFKPAVQN